METDDPVHQEWTTVKAFFQSSEQIFKYPLQHIEIPIRACVANTYIPDDTPELLTLSRQRLGSNQ